VKTEIYARGAVPLVRIHAPEIYKDPAFKEWFFKRPPIQAGTTSWPAPPVATWHGDLADDKFHENSDMFIIADLVGDDDGADGDGSESDMPEHIWTKLLTAAWTALKKPPHAEVLLWVSNIEGQDPSPAEHLAEICRELSTHGFRILDSGGPGAKLNPEVLVAGQPLTMPDLVLLRRLRVVSIEPKLWSFDGPPTLAWKLLFADVQLAPNRSVFRKDKSEQAEPGNG
jgi:hypothetical protein